jgi:hypothetical protein
MSRSVLTLVSSRRMRSNSSDEMASLLLRMAFGALPSGLATEYVGINAQLFGNASLAGSVLRGQLYGFALEFIRKLPSFHLLPPIVESYLSKVSIIAGEAQNPTGALKTSLQKCTMRMEAS